MYLYCDVLVRSGLMYWSMESSMKGLGMESAKTDLGGGTGAKITGNRQLIS